MRHEVKRARKLSLNTDIGEGYGVWRIADDAQLLELVTDANIACGFHAGDPDIMRATCRIAVQTGATVGAQVGFRDLQGFGRRFIEIPAASLTNDVVFQLGALAALAHCEGSEVRYVKAHGALYHAAIKYSAYADAIITAVHQFDRTLPIMCQPDTAFAHAVTAAGLTMIREGYVDRAYDNDGLLVPRGTAGSTITDVAAVRERTFQLATTGTIETIDGHTIAMEVDSICIHSDSPNAVAMAQAVRQRLAQAGVELTSALARPAAPDDLR